MSQKTILITDDEPHMRRLVQFNLGRLGHRIELAASGGEALEKAATLSVDLLVIDVVMAGIDGFATVRELRKDPRHRALPVIMLTSRGLADTREKADDLGVNVFLTKPFSPIELTRRVSELLGGDASDDGEAAASART